MNSSLNLFTQSDILRQVGLGSLQQFLNQFADSDPQLTSAEPDSPYFFCELARLFAQTERLSPALRETLVLLESAASPKYSDRLTNAVQARFANLFLTEFHPLALALELWLACPDDVTQIQNRQPLTPTLSPSDGARERTEQLSVDGFNVQIGQGNPLPVGRGEDKGEGFLISDWLPSMQSSTIENPNSKIKNQAGLLDDLTSSGDRMQPFQGCGSSTPRSQGSLASSATLGFEPESLQDSANSIQQSTNPSIRSSDFSPSENQNSKFKIQNSLLEGLTCLISRYVILPEHAAEALALWIVHTYAFELRDVTTYLALESPVRRCGKTTLLNILSRLVNRPLVAANVSPSALYRAIEELRPTLMIDEADTFLKSNDELIGILNAGYHRATAYVLRVSNDRAKEVAEPSPSIPLPIRLGEGAPPSEKSVLANSLSPSDGESIPGKKYLPSEPMNPTSADFLPLPIRWGEGRGEGLMGRAGVRGSRLVRFSCWCPKIIARIGRLPETLADRCIVIRMQRKTPNDQCERFRDLDTIAARMIALRQQCEKFVQDHRDAIISAKPEIPAALNDRAADIWEPLLAIADCAGGDWPARARAAAVALSNDTRENNPVGLLLLDIFSALRHGRTGPTFDA